MRLLNTPIWDCRPRITHRLLGRSLNPSVAVIGIPYLCNYDRNTLGTRMHSSRMRTVRCSGRQGCVCIPACTVQGGVCPGCVSDKGGVLGGVSHHALGQGGVTPPPVDRILDTRLWKHYLSATIVADGNYAKLSFPAQSYPMFSLSSGPLVGVQWIEVAFVKSMMTALWKTPTVEL